MIVEHTESFQAWLAKVLKPLCDADPGALAKYVLALIKKDKTEKELRQSMIDQLDVFLQSETKPFVDKLFEALTTKEYLKADAPLEEDKPGGSAPEPPPESGPSSNQAEVTKDDGQKKGSLSVVPSALLNEPQENKEEKTAAPPTSGPSSSSSRLGRDRRDDDRDKNRRKRGRDRRDTRSRSGERGPPISKRSRSPRLDRDRERDRIRHRPGRKSPPPRRYERDWDRRRSRSPLGGRRSVSPRNHRSRSPPPRYRRPFNNSRSRSRSPRQSRSRSPHGPKSGSDKDKKDSLLPIPDADLTKDLDKPLVQSVVVRPDGVPPPGRGRCRDFDEKGLCMKGELCPFDHGNDPVVLEDIVVPSAGPGYGAGGRPLVPPGAPGYTPPIGVRPPMIGEYYPDSPALDPAPWGPGAPPFRPRHMPFDGMPRGRGGLLLRPSMGPYPVPGGQRQLISVPVVGGGVPPQPGVPVMGPVPPMPQMLPPNLRGGLGRGHHHHRGRGGFDHGRLGAKPPRHYTNCSLEVRKIPREQNTIMDLNSHFLRFGKIINIQINHDNDPEAALVTFSSPAEAQLAYRSTEAVLNNRFIRVFWHNKEKENEDETDFPPGAAGGPPRISVKDRLGGQAPEPMEHEKILISGNNLTKTVYNNAALTKKLETQDKLQSNESIKRSQEMLAAQVTLKNLQDQKKAETLKMSNDLRKRQQTMMEEQIVQQKKLIAKLEGGNIPAKEKDEALKILKMLSENVQKLKKDLDGSAPNTSPKKQTAPPVIVAATAGLNPRTKEETQKEMLDAELDLINKEQQGEDTIDLQNRLQELRQKAKSMGLIGRGGGVIRGRGGFRGVIRGFGRGRGMIRGRGRGSVRALRSVDRRPTKIKITGFSAAKLSDILTHFSMFGPIRDYQSDAHVPMMIVDFDSRKCAEVAMANGSMFEESKLTLEWVSPDPPEGGSHMAGKLSDSSLSAVVGGTSQDDAPVIDDDDDIGDDDEDAEISHLIGAPEDEEEDEDDRSWRR